MATATLKYKINNQGAHRFTMWLFLVTISMIFAGFTSAFLVQKGNTASWTAFDIPAIFKVSTLLIILSSVFLHVAHIANKKQHKALTTVGLFFTLVLGLLFCYYQVQGWKQLTDLGIYLSFNPNPAAPFFYVITFVHVLHVAGGILFLSIALIHSIILFGRPASASILDEIESTEKGVLKVRTDLLILYWHFLGLLWLYLYFFLTINLK